MSIGGFTTSIDINNTVSNIIAQERRPLSLLEVEKKSIESRKGAWDRVQATLEAFQDRMSTLQKASAFKKFVASSDDTSVATASSTTNATPAKYEISGITLATAASLTGDDLTAGFSNGTKATKVSTEDIDVSNALGADVNAILDTSANTKLTGNGTSGSFKINGQTVSVNAATDTVMTVLTKINNSGAGVTASYDASTGLVTMRANAVGSLQEITFTDVSGTNFLALIEVDDAVLTSGSSPDKDRPIDQTIIGDGDAGDIVDGFFTINNITFQVDASNDKLQTVIDRVNNSVAGVTLFYDDKNRKVTLTSDTEGEDITLGNDTSEFLDRLGLYTGPGVETIAATDASFTLNGAATTRDSNTFTVNGTTINLLDSVGSVTITVSLDEDNVEDNIKAFVDQYNETYDAVKSELAGDLKGERSLRNILKELELRVVQSHSNPGTFQTLFDIGVEFERKGNKTKLTLDTGQLTTVIRQGINDVFRLFAFDSDSDGLFDDGGLTKNFKDYLVNFTKSTFGFIDARLDVLDNRVDRIDTRITKKEEELRVREKDLFDEITESLNAIQELQARSNVLTAARNAAGF